MIASTVARVPDNTADDVNQRIRLMTEQRVASCASRGRDAIDRRLAELDQEWDMERTLDANTSIISLDGLTLGASVDRKWFLLPAAVSGFLLQHAVQEWCPPLPILRRLGIRTPRKSIMNGTL